MVTGGIDYPNYLATVQVYTLSGPQEQLPSLQTPRRDHACAHYLDSQDRVVSIACQASDRRRGMIFLLILNLY